MRSFTLSDATAPPLKLLIEELKKYLSSNTPRGVCMYLFVVTRLIVDSCMLRSSATSRKTRGLR